MAKRILHAIGFWLMVLMPGLVLSGSLADKVGAYRVTPGESAACEPVTIDGQTFQTEYRYGVCFPLKRMRQKGQLHLMSDVVVELRPGELLNPQTLYQLYYLEYPEETQGFYIRSSYRTELERVSGKVFHLKDESQYERVSGQSPGNLSRGEPVVVFEDINHWNLCVGGELYTVEQIDAPTPYSRQSEDLHERSWRKLVEMDECGPLDVSAF